MFAMSWIKNALKLTTVFGLSVGLTAYNMNSKDNIARADSKPKIVASHSVICDLVRSLAEDTVDLTCLIDGDRDPHSYNPTPSQLKAMEEAQLVLYGGYQLEPKIIKLIEASETQTPKLAIYEQVVSEPILSQHDHGDHEGHNDHDDHEGHEGHEGHNDHDDHEGHDEAKELEPDPHVWHNVENVVAAIELIQPILLQINTSEAARYLQNSSNLTEDLWQLDAWIKEQVATIPEGNKVLVTSHDSFNYFVQAYRLEDYKTLQGLSTESSPTASQVKNLAEQIEKLEVPAIFVENSASDRVMKNVAKTANVELATKQLFADGLGTANNYSEMMTHNVCAIVDGLGGECKSFSE